MTETTPKTPWTPEPWAIQGNHIEGWDREMARNDVIHCAAFKSATWGYDEAKANAERIVACVNAMKGIDDPQAFRDAVEREHKAVDALIQHIDEEFGFMGIRYDNLVADVQAARGEVQR